MENKFDPYYSSPLAWLTFDNIINHPFGQRKATEVMPFDEEEGESDDDGG